MYQKVKRLNCVYEMEDFGMAITHDYTLICEQVRIELGGKFTVVGLTTSGIGLPQIPFPLLSLTFLNVLKTDTPGDFKFIGKLTQLLSGGLVARAEGRIQPPVAGPIVMPMQFGNIQFAAFGAYTWSLEFDGQEPFLTEFQVTHVPQPGPHFNFQPRR
jgi:hypothetical protein